MLQPHYIDTLNSFSTLSALHGFGQEVQILCVFFFSMGYKAIISRSCLLALGTMSADQQTPLGFIFAERFKPSPRHHFEKPSLTTKNNGRHFYYNAFFMTVISFCCLSLSPNVPFVERRLVHFPAKCHHQEWTGHAVTLWKLNLDSDPASRHGIWKPVHRPIYPILPLSHRSRSSDH